MSTVQMAVPEINPATRLQPGVLEVPLRVNVTLPPGAVAPKVDVSMTVAVHVDTWFTTTGLGVQATCVVVLCLGGDMTETVTVVVLLNVVLFLALTVIV